MLVDKNHDGLISPHEFQMAMHSLGTHSTVSEIQNIIDEFDKEDKGALNFNEFLEMMKHKSQIVNDEDEDIKVAFRIFDKDSDGHVSADEMKQTLSNFGVAIQKEEIVRIIESADYDGDKMLNFVEFCALVKSNDSFRLC